MTQHKTAGRKPLDSRAYEVASRIRQARESNDYSFEYISKNIDVPIPTYKAWENQFGESSERKHLHKLTSLYKISPNWFKYGTEEEYVEGLQASTPKISKILTQEQREKLANRAKIRRIAAGLNAAEFARLIDIRVIKLYQWEVMLPPKPEHVTECLWENHLQVPEGWLRDIEIIAPEYDLSVMSTVSETDNRNTTIAEEIRMIACWLSIARITKRTTNLEALSEAEKRSVNVFAQRYGVYGESRSILQIIGNEYGITRERIRQITEKMAERAALLTVKTPCIDKLAEEIKQFLPDTIKALDEKFRELLGEELSIESVDRFSREILGKKIVDFTENPVMMAINPESHDPILFKALREASHRMIRACGAAQIYYVLGDVSNMLQKAVPLEDAEKACSLMSGFEWISEDSGWFWFGHETPAENKLHYVTRKILAVANRKVDIEDILQGLIRNRREKYDETLSKVPPIEPPMSIAMAVLAKTPWLKVVQSDDFLLLNQIAVEDCIQGAELKVYQYLDENNGVASRHSITKYLVDKNGMNLVTLSVVLDSSPILARLDTGIFCLRGRPIDADAMREALDTVWGVGAVEGRPSRQIVTDADGWIEIGAVLNKYNIDRRMFTIASSIRHHFENGQELSVSGTNDKVVFRKYENGECRLNGLLSILLRMGAKENDAINLKVNQMANVLKLVNIGSQVLADQ